MSTTTIIPVRSITINWAEGPVRGITFPLTYSSVGEANRTLSRLAQDAPRKGEGYNKVDFTIEWEDGQKHHGRFDLQHPSTNHEPYCFINHVRHFHEFYSGRKQPHWLTPEAYQKLVQDCGVAESCGQFLDSGYELGH